MYCVEGIRDEEYYGYKVTVPESGIYEMAIHTQLRDTRERAAMFTVNKDTANEYTFELSYQFATDEEVNAARENEYTISSYMYGIKIALQAGDNYIKIEESSKIPKGIQFRDFYFVKVEE